MSPLALAGATPMPLQRSNSLSGESGTQSRPAFTTSLSDFALRTSLPARHDARPALEHSSVSRERHSYHLRPRSNLSRSVIVASQDDDETEADAEPTDSKRVIQDHAQAPQIPINNNYNAARINIPDHTPTEDQEDSETAAALRAFHTATSTSPQIARTINAGYAARMGSLPPLSPKSFKVPYTHPRNHRHHRRDTATSLATSPIVRNTLADDVGEEQIGDLDLDHDVDVDDIELHLDGMDMKMTDVDDASSPKRPRATSSSPPPSPSRRSSPRTPRRTSSLVFGDLRDDGRRTSAEYLPIKGDTENRQLPSAPPSAPAFLPPSLKRVMYSLRDESEPSQSEIASEAKLTRKLSSAQQAAEVEAMRWNVVARRAGANVGTGESAAVAGAPQHAGRHSSPWLLPTGVNASLPPAVAAPTPFSGGVASDFHEEHLLDDVGFESDGLTSSDDDAACVDNAAESNGETTTTTNETQMALDDGSEHLDTDHDHSKCGLGIMDVQTPPPRHMDLPLMSPTIQPLYPPSLSTTPTQPPPAMMSNLTLNLSTSQRKRSGSAWTNFRNSPSATSSSSSHHHHHHYFHPYAVLRGSPGTGGMAATATGRHLQRLRGGAPGSVGTHIPTTAAPQSISRLSTSPAAIPTRSAVMSTRPTHRPLPSPGASQHPQQGKRKFGATTPVLTAATLSASTSASPSDDEEEGDGANKRRALSPRVYAPAPALQHQGYFALPLPLARSSASSSPLLEAAPHYHAHDHQQHSYNH